MLDASIAGACENIFPGNDAGADVGEELHLSVWTGGRCIFGLWKLFDVLDVDGREAAWILIEIIDGILARDGDPAEVEFHFDVVLVAVFQKVVVGKSAIERFRGLKFERVVVIGELDAGFLGRFAALVEEIGGALPTVVGVALRRLDPGIDDDLVADSVSGVELFGPGFFERAIWDVAGGSGEAVLIENGANVFGGFIEVAGELDFFVADSGDFGDGAFEVGLHGVANGVKLNADGADHFRHASGERSLCGERCGDGCTDEFAAIHERSPRRKVYSRQFTVNSKTG